ncbi:hypothetical protein ABIA43_005403 [Bradyrhizobium sp. USDA 328]
MAVCRSSASRVSLNSRAFSMAITAWSAKVWSSCTRSGAKAPVSARVTLIMPTGAPRFISGMNSTLRKPRSRANSRFSSGTSAASLSGNWIVSPSRTSAKVGKSAILRGNDALSPSSASGLVGVNATRCSSSPMNWSTVAEKPPSRCFELDAIAAKTGRASEGEAAMVRRISALALWRSRAIASSLRSRAFSAASSAAISFGGLVIRNPA